MMVQRWGAVIATGSSQIRPDVFTKLGNRDLAR
jgi:hypothetical protein